MKTASTAQGMFRVLLWIGISTIPAAWLELVRVAAGSAFSWGGLVARWALVGLLLCVSWYTRPRSSDEISFLWPYSGVVVLATGSMAIIYYVLSGATAAAWLVIGSLYIMLLGMERGLTSGGSILWRWAARASIIALGGAVPVALAQLETRFSEEEFFIALPGLALSIFTTLLILAQALLARHQPRPAKAGLRIRRHWLGLTLTVAAVIGIAVTVRAYQGSFYPPEAPAFEGISEESPFLCGTVQPDPQVYTGEETFQQLLAQVAASPYAETPEYGMLALGTGEQAWAEAFRESILAEAADGSFTEAANTVKSAQHLAALRIYYLSAVLDRFPDLFAPEEVELLKSWAADINRRAQTVELVDWMYALAFSKWPEGPYENQENGAGLLALLEAGELAAPELSDANRDYLERNPRGWTARFRNTDDALIYQPEWITNAFFQAQYTGEEATDNISRSFEWLLLQALPDGAPFSYNFPYQPSLAGVAYFGSQLLDDPTLLWLAGRTLDYAMAAGRHLPAQPGADQAVSAISQSPTVGSCLLYGDSGLPNQTGPLAPDKLIFRDGWSKDDTYLLLNLRFTGWHRYKATNTISLVYRSETLAQDTLDVKAFDWLPEGRSFFRDKRIPRENLNGLLIPRNGFDAVTYYLTGVGQPWAQDPPYYATVVSFETNETLDWSHTRIEDWDDWQHDRWIYVYHDGPIVVVDSADGPVSSRAALAWHLVQGAGAMEEGRLELRNEEKPAEVVLLGDNGLWAEQNSQDLLYYSAGSGHLRNVTVFLVDEWVGAEVKIDPNWNTLRILQGDSQLVLQLPASE